MNVRFPRLVVACIALSGAVTLSALQAPQTGGAATQQPPSPDSTFNVDVTVMTLSVTVTDDKGKSVNGLTKEDFVLLEDGKQQPISAFRAVTGTEATRAPFGLGLVLDVSGSMNKDRLDSMRTAVETLVNKRMNEEDQLYFLEFASSPRLVMPWTNDRKEVLNAIRRIKTRDGTAIYDAIAAALPISAQGKHKKEVMLVITDGQDTHSKTSRPKLAEMARAAEVLVYALVVDGEEMVSGQDTSVIRQAAAELSQVTDATGGRTQYLRGFQQLEDAIGNFGKDLTSQYEISFERTAGKDGKFHPVRVGVRRQGVTVRHKLGYLAN
jgi:Ca-activated chloride channel family protein